MKYLCLCCIVSLQIYAVDIELAQGIVEESMYLYMNGELVSAAEMANIALSFDDENSDALYLSIIDVLGEQDSTAKQIKMLAAALDSDSWKTGLRRHALIDFASLLVQTKDYQKIISTLEREVSTDADTDLLYYLLVAYYQIGDHASVEAILDRTLGTVSFDRRFFVLRAINSPPIFPYRNVLHWLRANRVADESVFTLIRHTLGELGAIFSMSATEESVEGRQQTEAPQQDEWEILNTLVKDYYELGGKDALVGLLALKYNIVSPKSWEDLAEEVISDKYLIDWVIAHLPDKRESLRTLLQDFSGTISYDSNRDGYQEAEYHIQNGLIHQYIMDSNQDGEAEIILGFDPLQMRYRDPEILLEYNFYPELSRVTFFKDDHHEVWHLNNEQLFLQIFEHPIAEAPRPWDNLIIMDTLPSIEELVHASFLRYRSYDNRTLHYRRGEPWLEVFDSNDDGQFDELYYLSRGLRILAMLDRNFDDVFEYFIFYENGLPSLTLIDEDGDDSIEYIASGNDVTYLSSDVVQIQREKTILQHLYRFAERSEQKLQEIFSREE